MTRPTDPVAPASRPSAPFSEHTLPGRERPRRANGAGRRVALPGLAALAALGCGGPHLYLPAGAPVPPVSGDAARLALLDDGDGVSGREVLRVSSFALGERTWYWGFGIVGRETMDLYVLCRREGAGACRPLPDHPPIAEALPGMPDYHPFGRVIDVEVTAAYAGERIPSGAALEEAVRDGLVRTPVPRARYREIPIVHPDVRLELSPGTFATPTPIYAEGYEGAAFDFSATHGEYALPDEGVPVRNVYVLTREGETLPLSEPARMTDITGDGDTNDSNQTFGVGIASPDYTPLWRMVRVTVPATYASIDTSMDETMAEYMDAHDMFDVAPDYTITPIAGRVVSFELTDMLINCPLQSAPGML